MSKLKNKQMAQNLDIQELSIVIAANGLNPAILNPDFLKYSGIVPTDWELARPPVLSTRVTQIVFQSGVSIVAQPGSIAFSESVSAKPVDEVTIATLARKYVETMPNAEYQAVGINPKRIITFDDQSGAARQYIAKTLLAPGTWQQIGNTPAQASVNLTYNFEQCRFNLNITESRLQTPEEETIPAVLFAGSFNYNITAEDVAARTKQMNQAIATWKSNLKIYHDLLESKFLPKPKTEPASTVPAVKNA